MTRAADSATTTLPPLARRERPARGTADGALVLIHGRGSDEHDLFGLFDALDPERRLHCVTPRGPFAFTQMPGAHWYQFNGVGTPDPETFYAGLGALRRLVDEVAAAHELSPDRVVVGGFSQGCVMSIALTLDARTPRLAGLLGLSGFLPVVADWPCKPNLDGLPVFMAHGTLDPVIPVELGETAAAQLAELGADVQFGTSAVPHTIDPRILPAAADWLDAAVPARG